MIVSGEKVYFLIKLINFGCSRKFVTILLNMYSSVKSAVKLEQGVTPFFQSHVGVK
jgi:hypothetical protein